MSVIYGRLGAKYTNQSDEFFKRIGASGTPIARSINKQICQ